MNPNPVERCIITFRFSETQLIMGMVSGDGGGAGPSVRVS